LDMKWIKAVNLLLSTVKCYGGEFNLGAWPVTTYASQIAHLEHQITSFWRTVHHTNCIIKHIFN
jgi:hypothetical protein